jgi:branched-chain amino acid transport system ATP-binding protein
MNTLLAVDGVTMRFRGSVALDNVSFDCAPGQITGLIGPNGAGKTTMFNVVSGLLKPSSGRVVLDGRDITRAKPVSRARAGLGRTFQRLELFTTLSVRDNLKVAGEMAPRQRRGDKSVGERLSEVMELVGLNDVADREVGELPTGRARMVEVGRALMTHPTLLLLDEPASGLDEAETEAFRTFLVAMVRAGGPSVCIVEHDVPLVLAICDRIHVLDYGKRIATGTPEEIRTNKDVIDAYLGAVEEVI